MSKAAKSEVESNYTEAPMYLIDHARGGERREVKHGEATHVGVGIETVSDNTDEKLPEKDAE